MADTGESSGRRGETAASGRAPASSHDAADWFDQAAFGIRFGWGPSALRRLAPNAAPGVIVDVLSFSTAVDVAVSRGVTVLPYRWHDGSEAAFAESHDAEVAQQRRSPEGWTLSPTSLAGAPAGLKLVLPSPNGSALTFGASEAGATTVRVGCLRNAAAVASRCEPDETVAVIAAGERWRGATGPLRPALEDLVGAGAILSALARHRAVELSPEARAAVAVGEAMVSDLGPMLRQCGSGVELIDKGFGSDVDMAAEYNVSTTVPTLVGNELIDRT